MQFEDESSPDDLGFCLSFSCYFSDNNSIASAAAKVICELKQESQARFYEFSDVDEEEFQFSPDCSDEQVSAKQIDDFDFIFPVLDRVVQELGDAASPVSNNQLQKSSSNKQESYSSSSSSSFSSSEVDANDCNCKPSRIFCMWMPNTEAMSSIIAKCKKISSSAGNISGSRRWRIWNSFRRINSEKDESVLFLRSSKKTDASKERPKQKLVTASPSFHEVFYVQKRAEQKGDKMKSFLPYKQDLLGFFVNVNKFGNKKFSS